MKSWLFQPERGPGSGSLNVHINFSPVTLGGGATPTATTRTTAGGGSVPGGGGAGVAAGTPSQQGATGGSGGGSNNSVAEAAQRLAQIQRNLALAEQAMRRLEVRERGLL